MFFLGLERHGAMVYLDLGSEVLHDGADELGFVGGEGGGFVARGSGSGVVIHDGVVVVLIFGVFCAGRKRW
jgi:hypothetical protein